MHKILTVVGARPQFVKAGALSPTLRQHFEECLVHTGQHYDAQMSDVFFQDLNIPDPNYSLGIGSGSHATQTAEMMKALETVMLSEQPQAVLVYGDTNSTLAAALVAVKLHISLIHVEAGLRSHNLAMPEEVNRVMTDHVGQLLCAPTREAMKHLHNEGLADKACLTGDVMCAAVVKLVQDDRLQSDVVSHLNLSSKPYAVVTLHRADMTAHQERMSHILNALQAFPGELIFPVHPRTKRCLQEWGMWDDMQSRDQWYLIEPLGYFDFLCLMYRSDVMITDSGGVQKESGLLGVPTLTLREETEWVETVETGWNQLIGYAPDVLQRVLEQPLQKPDVNLASYYGEGKASENIVEAIRSLL